MSLSKILFIDRDGTLITEPDDKQIDSLDKFALEPGVIAALLALRDGGYRFVMVSNQDGLGTGSFPLATFEPPQALLLDILRSQGIEFDDILICPHLPEEGCECRKPRLGLVLDYLRDANWDRTRSCVIGDRDSDDQLAANMGIASLHYNRASLNWPAIATQLLGMPRTARVQRRTRETDISVELDLDRPGTTAIATGIGFFDHMLEQIAKNAGVSLNVCCRGDLHIDEHHTVEDVALCLGAAFRQALGDKFGVARYGFVLPMDEALAHVALDLSGRAYFVFEGAFRRERVGELPTELVAHFFRSFADACAMTLNMRIQGDNDHHCIESLFKGFGRALRQAIRLESRELPSTKGVLA